MATLRTAGTTTRRCSCPTGRACPDRARKGHTSHGYAVYLQTSNGRRELRRYGFPTKRAAGDALDQVRDLVRLAGADDRVRRRVGDLIAERSKRRGQLPSVEEIRRKLGAGLDPDAAAPTVAEYAPAWLAGKRAVKATTRRACQQHLDHYIVPTLGEIPLDRLRAEHVAGLFTTIEERNAELAAARREGRLPRLPGDRRQAPRVINAATMHRVYATLRGMLNMAVKQRIIGHNPCVGVELPRETRDPARVWGPDQVAVFLDATEGDPYALLWRLVLLRGLRRGEACGLRWADVDLDGGRLEVRQTVLQVGGETIIGSPKTRAGGRVVSLDRETVAVVRRHRAAQLRDRMAAGEAYEDRGWVFAGGDGGAPRPDRVSRRFRLAARDAGLPPIRLHEGRHSAATLALEAGLDIKVVSDQLGHSTTRITTDLYQHVRRAVHDDAAERVVALLPGRASPADSGGGRAGREGV